MTDLDDKLIELKTKVPATDIDDGTLRHILEQADGNIEHALKQVRAMTGEDEAVELDADKGYKLGDADEIRAEALGANRAGSTTPTTSVHAVPPVSSVPTSTSTTTSTITPPPANPDPQLAELKVMFPSVESVVIEAVLETHAGKSKDERMDKAIEDLLQLTDPDYKPDSNPPATTPLHAQTNLDEEFARSLQIAEERQAQVQARSEREVGSSLSSPASSAGLAYQPRTSRYARQGGPAAGGGGRQGPDGGYVDVGQSMTGYDSYGRPIQERQDGGHAGFASGAGGGRFGGLWGGEGGGQDQGASGGFAAAGPGIEEKIVKYAEVGKQTLDKFLSTARTKVNEFEQLQTQRQAAAGSGGQSGGITETLGGIFNDAKAVATGRRDGLGGGYHAQGQTQGQGQGQAQGGFGAGVGSAFSGLSGLFGGRVGGTNSSSQPQQQQPSYRGGQSYGSSWSNPGQGQNRATAQNARGGALNTASGQNRGVGTGSRRWQPTDIFDDLDEPSDHQNRTIKVHQPGSSASSASSVPLSDAFLEDNHTPKPESDLGKRFEARSVGGGGSGGIGAVGGGLEVAPGSGSTGSGSPAQKIDLSKLGMLPKRQVSLLGSSPSSSSKIPTVTESVHKQIQPANSSASTGTTRSAGMKEDVDDEEEFTKSPFEN